MPDKKKTSRNLLLPINFSRINPNKARANILNRICEREACRNIAVTNLHGSSHDCWFNKRASVNTGITSWRIKKSTHTSTNHNEQYLIFAIKGKIFKL
jgi:hypothetical protein